MTTNGTAKPAAPLLTWAIPLTITASFVCLALRPDLRHAVPLLVGVTAAITLILALALHGAEKGTIAWSPVTIIAVAALLRLIFLVRPPELSDDIYRYLWDGLQTLAGNNPYAAAPASAPPADGAAVPLLRLVNHPELVTIYPPTAQYLFAAGALFGKSVLGMKALLAILDLAACLLIVRLLKALRLPPERAVLYAWHPLPVLEIAGSGHIDGAGMLFLLIALNLLAPLIGKPDSYQSSAIHSFPFKGEARRGMGCPGADKTHPHPNPPLEGEGVDESPSPSARGMLSPLAAGFACAGAILVKLLPLVFLPGLLILVRGRTRKLLVCGVMAGAALLALPFLPDLANGLTTLGTYARDWEFSGFAFRTLRAASSGKAAREVLAAIFLAVAALTYWQLRRSARTDAGLDGTNKLRATLTAFYGVAFAFLLLTPTLHPWYALTLAVLLPFAAGPAGLVLCWSVFLAYRVLIPYTLLGLWIEDNRTAALIALSPAIAYLIPKAVRFIAQHRTSPVTLP